MESRCFISGDERAYFRKVAAQFCIPLPQRTSRVSQLILREIAEALSALRLWRPGSGTGEAAFSGAGEPAFEVPGAAPGRRRWRACTAKRSSKTIRGTFLPVISCMFNPNHKYIFWTQPKSPPQPISCTSHPTPPHPPHPTNLSSCSYSSLGVPTGAQRAPCDYLNIMATASALWNVEPSARATEPGATTLTMVARLCGLA